jgi:hypothetical protein
MSSKHLHSSPPRVEREWKPGENWVEMIAKSLGSTPRPSRALCGSSSLKSSPPL